MPKGVGGGRPERVLVAKDWETIKNLCKIQCTQEEVASVMDLCLDTLQYKCEQEMGISFSEFYKQERRKGTASLRRAQWLKAIEGKNPALLIWLGKQMLGQTDQPRIDAFEGDVIFQSRIGPGGNIIQEIRSLAEDGTAMKTFDAKEILNAEASKKTKKKAATKKAKK